MENDNRKWKERVDKLLAKYDRIDPVEYKKALEEKEEATKSLEQLKTKYDEDIARERNMSVAFKAKCEEFLKKIRESIHEKKRLEATILELQNKSAESSSNIQSEKKALQTEITLLKSSLVR